MEADWTARSADPTDDGESQGEGVPHAEVVAHFQPEPESVGVDGTAPAEAGIQGRLTDAGGTIESDRDDRDWQVHLDVDQPVQRIDQ